MFANLAFKSLPVHTNQMITLLFVHLSVQPVLKTFKMNETDTTSALARYYTWILKSAFIAPAETTVSLGFLTGGFDVSKGEDWLCLFEFLLV